MSKSRGLLLCAVLAWSIALTVGWDLLRTAEVADAAPVEAVKPRPAAPTVLQLKPEVDAVAQRQRIDVAALQPTRIIPVTPLEIPEETAAAEQEEEPESEPATPSSTGELADEQNTADDAQAEPGIPEPASSPVPLTPELVKLRQKIRSVLEMYYPRHLNTQEHDPWQVMHAIIAYGVDTKLFRSGNSGPTVNAVGWMCFNNPCAGERMLYLDHSRLVARKGPGLQGHMGQFLAILAQSHVKIDYPMEVGGKRFTLRDFVEHEKADCEAGTELTFKLIGLMHYVDSDETWTSRNGQQWSIERLIREEIKQPIRGAACGGTHRLMGLSYAVRKQIKRDKPVEGEFRRAQIYINDFHRYAFSLQNDDGSFSTEWFTRPAADRDVQRRLKTSGHIIEWLSFSLIDEDLRHPKMVQAVDYLAGILKNDPKRKWEVGPLGHGLHALAMYDTRVFKPAEATDAPIVAPVIRQPAAPVDSPKAATKPKVRKDRNLRR